MVIIFRFIIFFVNINENIILIAFPNLLSYSYFKHFDFRLPYYCQFYYFPFYYYFPAPPKLEELLPELPLPPPAPPVLEVLFLELGPTLPPPLF